MRPAMEQNNNGFGAVKYHATWFWSLLACVSVTVAQEPLPRSPIITYTLLDGSYFIDECLICGRPTILQPLRGTFDLVLIQNTAPYVKYAVRDVDFTASPAWAGDVRITGGGTYVRFEEFALLQDMDLALQIKDAFTNRPDFFTHDTRTVEKPFPLIK